MNIRLYVSVYTIGGKAIDGQHQHAGFEYGGHAPDEKRLDLIRIVAPGEDAKPFYVRADDFKRAAKAFGLT